MSSKGSLLSGTVVDTLCLRIWCGKSAVSCFSFLEIPKEALDETPNVSRAEANEEEELLTPHGRITAASTP